MALTDYEIQESDYTGNDVSGLSDKPSLTAAQLKARFDSLVKNVVVAKFNGLIAALVTTVSGLISKVSGGTEDNFASLTSGGEVQDSGKKATDFEASGAVNAHNGSLSAHGGIATRHYVYKGSLDAAWYKILSFPTTDNACVRITGYSSAAYYDERGHWELIVNRANSDSTIRADLIYATNGITVNSFDVRVDGGVITVYFYFPQYTYYRVVSEAFLGGVTLTTYSTEVTPSGTAITISWSELGIGSTADLPVFTGTSGTLETKTAESARNALGVYTYHGNVTSNDLGSTLSISWAKTTMAYSVNRNDYHVSAGSAATQASPINVSCQTNGSVKVLWDRMVGDDTVTVPVTIIGIET